MRDNYSAGVAAGAAAGVSAGVAAGAAAGAGVLTGAGAAALGTGAAFWMLETLMGVLTANDAQMLTTQMKIARVHVAFSMKSVVLRYPRYWLPLE